MTCPTCGRAGQCGDCCCTHPAHADRRQSTCPRCKHRVATAEALRVIQRTADEQGSVTMLRLAENLANDAALVRLAQAEGWDEAIAEAEACGLLNDAFADEMRGRNPYRNEGGEATGR